MLVEADMPGDHDFGYVLADSATTMRLSKIRLAAGNRFGGQISEI
jgi:hypothetical protein